MRESVGDPKGASGLGGVVAELNAILADGYDREAFERALGRSDALSELIERLGRTASSRGAACRRHLFRTVQTQCRVAAREDGGPSVLINRTLVGAVLESGVLKG